MSEPLGTYQNIGVLVVQGKCSRKFCWYVLITMPASPLNRYDHAGAYVMVQRIVPVSMQHRFPAFLQHEFGQTRMQD